MNPESQQEQRPQKKSGPRRKYDQAFRQQALERMKTCDNISALARELGLRRKWLYRWRNEAESQVAAPQRLTKPKASPADRDKKRMGELEKKVAQQALELDFFKGALLRIEEKRKREATADMPSTSKSASRRAARRTHH